MTPMNLYREAVRQAREQGVVSPEIREALSPEAYVRALEEAAAE